MGQKLLDFGLMLRFAPKVVTSCVIVAFYVNCYILFLRLPDWSVVMIIFLCSPQARARQLFKAGYKSLNSLAWADVNSLMADIEHLSRRQANQIVSAAKVKPVELDGSLVAVREVVVLSVHTYTLFIYCFSEKFTSFAHPQIAMANLKRDVLTKPITREEEDKKYKETCYRIFLCV